MHETPSSRAAVLLVLTCLAILTPIKLRAEKPRKAFDLFTIFRGRDRPIKSPFAWPPSLKARIYSAVSVSDGIMGPSFEGVWPNRRCQLSGIDSRRHRPDVWLSVQHRAVKASGDDIQTDQG